MDVCLRKTFKLTSTRPDRYLKGDTFKLATLTAGYRFPAPMRYRDLEKLRAFKSSIGIRSCHGWRRRRAGVTQNPLPNKLRPCTTQWLTRLAPTFLVRCWGYGKHPAILQEAWRLSARPACVFRESL